LLIGAAAALVMNSDKGLKIKSYISQVIRFKGEGPIWLGESVILGFEMN